MRNRLVIIAIVAATAVAGGVMYSRSGNNAGDAAGGASGAGRPPMGMGGMARPPMTVETAQAGRAEVSETLTVVGNLIGEATIQIVPKVSGRLQSITIKLGDRVSRGQVIARIEDYEIQEQVKQAEASYAVSGASIRQREADLTLARSNLERSRNLYERDLLPRQTLDDADSRYQTAVAQLDLARAQYAQAEARLEELRFTLSNTVMTSPVEGFVARRNLDPGAFVSTNSPIAEIVDVRSVRLVANLVERDVRLVSAGTPGVVEVDAYPGETFAGTVARVAPVLDPATRTAQLEIEVPNQDFRLKPGMYARVRLTVGYRPDALVVPRNALVDVSGQPGVFVTDGEVARFTPVEVGLQNPDRVEIRGGLDEGAVVVTTGAAGLSDGDRVLLAGRRPAAGAGPGAERPADTPGRVPEAGVAPGATPRPPAGPEAGVPRGPRGSATGSPPGTPRSAPGT